MTTLLRHSANWREQYDISIALLDTEHEAYSVPEWITVHRLDCRGSLLRSSWHLRRLVKTLRPEATVSFLTRSNVASWFARMGNDRPWVISERVNSDAHLGTGLAGGIARFLMRLCYPRASHVIAVSQGVANELSSRFAVPPAKISVIANPVDGEKIERQMLGTCPIVIDGPYIIAMGRLVENKNFALLIDAFAASRFRGKLVIAGDGPLRFILEQQAASLGLQGRVVFTGFMENPFPLVAKAQIFILPSNAEGFPNGLVEAMSAGIAVVSTNCKSGPSEILAGVSEMDIDEMTLAEFGILVPCNDAGAMAKAIDHLQHADVRQSYASLAAMRARTYSPEKAAQRYWNAIESTLKVKLC